MRGMPQEVELLVSLADSKGDEIPGFERRYVRLMAVEGDDPRLVSDRPVSWVAPVRGEAHGLKLFTLLGDWVETFPMATLRFAGGNNITLDAGAIDYRYDRCLFCLVRNLTPLPSRDEVIHSLIEIAKELSDG